MHQKHYLPTMKIEILLALRYRCNHMIIKSLCKLIMSSSEKSPPSASKFNTPLHSPIDYSSCQL